MIVRGIVTLSVTIPLTITAGGVAGVDGLVRMMRRGFRSVVGPVTVNVMHQQLITP
jgi:hypothetical protein